MSLDFELWGAGTARTLRPIWMAEELNLPYKLYPIGPRTGETQTKEYTELNPKQKIPLLKHGDFLLSESLAICRYLQDVSYSNEVFVSGEKTIKALEDQWCNFIYGELDERLSLSKYLAGNQYTIADIATWPWISRHEWHDVGLKNYKNLTRWYLDIATRKAVIKGYDLLKIGSKIPKP